MDCLKVLWKQAEASVSEVRAGLPRPLAYTTVMTVLDRMCVKGLVTRRKRGRAYAYAAALDLESARAQAVRQLLANLFEQDPRALVQYLLSRPAAGTRRTRASHAEIDDELL
jgi:predicted transcriptional regulator